MRPLPTLRQLRYLVAIADSGLNITQAAERVHATQPGLSKQLEGLELAAVGQTRAISFVPDESRVKEQYRGQEVKLTVALREVRQRVVPALQPCSSRAISASRVRANASGATPAVAVSILVVTLAMLISTSTVMFGQRNSSSRARARKPSEM